MSSPPLLFTPPFHFPFTSQSQINNKQTKHDINANANSDHRSTEAPAAIWPDAASAQEHSCRSHSSFREAQAQAQAVFRDFIDRQREQSGCRRRGSGGAAAGDVAGGGAQRGQEEAGENESGQRKNGENAERETRNTGREDEGDGRAR